MRQRDLGFLTCIALVTVCMFVTGCGSQPRVTACPGTSGVGCSCGPCPGVDYPFLYATTTSDQIAGFAINPTTGGLTSLPATTGPANSESITSIFTTMLVGDTSTNEVFSYAVGQTGTLTPVTGSPFSLGTTGTMPTSIGFGPSGYFYATESNGTIVGYSTPSDGTLTAPVPNSPYATGGAPSQIALGATNSGTTVSYFLYTANLGDPNGSILGYSIDASGGLTPVPGSPFATATGAVPSFIYTGSTSVVQNGVLTQSTEYLFVSLGNLGQLAIFAMDGTSGALTPVPGSPFTVGNGPVAMVEDSADHLFLLNGGDHMVAAYNLAANGVPTIIGSPVAAGTANGGLVLYPWNSLYAADTNSNAIQIFNVDHTSGAVTAAGSVASSSPPLQMVQVTWYGPQ